MGSKNRIAKYLLPIMLEEAKKHNITTWIEPFVGGANMIDKVPKEFKRIGYDINNHVIKALIGIRDNVNSLPENITEEDYKSYKGLEADVVTSWVRIACSFAGIFESKLASDKTGLRNYSKEAKRNALKQSPNIQNVVFLCDSFENLSFENSLIYCDPPYKGTTSYKTNPFPYEKFYEWCKEMKSKGNLIFISEYEMPIEFKEIWQGEIKTNFASTRKKATHNAIEKLFTL